MCKPFYCGTLVPILAKGPLRVLSGLPLLYLHKRNCVDEAQGSRQVFLECTFRVSEVTNQAKRIESRSCTVSGFSSFGRFKRNDSGTEKRAGSPLLRIVGTLGFVPRFYRGKLGSAALTIITGRSPTKEGIVFLHLTIMHIKHGLMTGSRR